MRCATEGVWVFSGVKAPKRRASASPIEGETCATTDRSYPMRRLRRRSPNCSELDGINKSVSDVVAGASFGDTLRTTGFTTPDRVAAKSSEMDKSSNI